MSKKMHRVAVEENREKLRARIRFQPTLPPDFYDDPLQKEIDHWDRRIKILKMATIGWMIVLSVGSTIAFLYLVYKYLN